MGSFASTSFLTSSTCCAASSARIAWTSSARPDGTSAALDETAKAEAIASSAIRYGNVVQTRRSRVRAREDDHGIWMNKVCNLIKSEAGLLKPPPPFRNPHDDIPPTH